MIRPGSFFFTITILSFMGRTETVHRFLHPKRHNAYCWSQIKGDENEKYHAGRAVLRVCIQQLSDGFGK